MEPVVDLFGTGEFRRVRVVEHCEESKDPNGAERCRQEWRSTGKPLLLNLNNDCFGRTSHGSKMNIFQPWNHCACVFTEVLKKIFIFRRGRLRARYSLDHNMTRPAVARAKLALAGALVWIAGCRECTNTRPSAAPANQRRAAPSVQNLAEAGAGAAPRTSVTSRSRGVRASVGLTVRAGHPLHPGLPSPLGKGVPSPISMVVRDHKTMESSKECS